MSWVRSFSTVSFPMSVDIAVCRSTVIELEFSSAVSYESALSSYMVTSLYSRLLMVLENEFELILFSFCRSSSVIDLIYSILAWEAHLLEIVGGPAANSGNRRLVPQYSPTHGRTALLLYEATFWIVRVYAGSSRLLSYRLNTRVARSNMSDTFCRFVYSTAYSTATVYQDER